jgi:hypothetical protein
MRREREKGTKEIFHVFTAKNLTNSMIENK